MHSTFSRASMARHMRAGDSRRFGVSLKTNREEIIDTALWKTQNTDLAIGNTYRSTIKGRTCHSNKDYALNLIWRTVSSYLIRRFRLRQKSRDDIVLGVIEALSDATPMHVLRIDIKSFYESINIEPIRKKILFDTVIPTGIRTFITSFFDQFSRSGVGIPRGLALSAVLAELAMQRSDQKIREIEGVYRYFRYADDLLIFCFKDVAETLRAVQDALPNGTTINQEKQQTIAICCLEKGQSTSKQIEYLGYSFSVNDLCGGRSPRIVNVRISSQKLKKIRSRIICTFKSFKKSRDLSLLVDRIQFLSSNYVAYRKGASTVNQRLSIRAGIHYNYRMCGIYDGENRKPYDCAELKAIDGFYFSLIKGSGSEFRSLLHSHRHRPLFTCLSKISFAKGYELRIMRNFSPDRIRDIRGAWRNV